MSESVDTLNKRLAEYYGRSPAGLPIYRLVFSDSQTEKRRGEFEEFLGKIFLRRVFGVREVPKYPYVKGRWILEVWLPISHPEIYNSEYNGSYEPLWVFQDINGNHQQPIWKAIQLLISWNENKVRKDAKMVEAEEEEERQRQEQKDFEILDNQMPSLVSKLASKEAVSVPKEYKNE